MRWLLDYSGNSLGIGAQDDLHEISLAPGVLHDDSQGKRLSRGRDLSPCVPSEAIPISSMPRRPRSQSDSSTESFLIVPMKRNPPLEKLSNNGAKILKHGQHTA